MIDDKDCPRTQSIEHLHSYLVSKRACSAALESLLEAYREWLWLGNGSEKATEKLNQLECSRDDDETESSINTSRTLVYFIADGEHVKIGFTQEAPERRLSQLQTGNARKLSLLGTIAAGRDEEKRLHAHFAPYLAHSKVITAVLTNIIPALH
jgi:hypothetical protein